MKDLVELLLSKFEGVVGITEFWRFGLICFPLQVALPVVLVETSG